MGCFPFIAQQEEESEYATTTSLQQLLPFNNEAQNILPDSSQANATLESVALLDPPMEIGFLEEISDSQVNEMKDNICINVFH